MYWVVVHIFAQVEMTTKVELVDVMAQVCTNGPLWKLIFLEFSKASEGREPLLIRQRLLIFPVRCSPLPRILRSNALSSHQPIERESQTKNASPCEKCDPNRYAKLRVGLR